MFFPGQFIETKKGREVKEQETVGFEKLQSKTRLRSQAVNVGFKLLSPFDLIKVKFIVSVSYSLS